MSRLTVSPGQLQEKTVTGEPRSGNSPNFSALTALEPPWVPRRAAAFEEPARVRRLRTHSGLGLINGGKAMRDIRGDLEERASLCQEQIRVAHSHFETMIQQLQRERDTRIADLKSLLGMVERLIEFENGNVGTVVTLPGSAVQHLTLADRIKAANG